MEPERESTKVKEYSAMRSTQWIRCLVLVAIAIWLPVVEADDWSRFRGPNGTGVSSEKGLPEAIDVDRNLQWKIIAGKGSSSPIVVSANVYFTSYQGDQRSLHCCELATGKTLWKQSVTKKRDENASAPNGPATCTPAGNGRRLVVLYPDSGLFCYDLQGKVIWTHDLGPYHSMHGIAGSPVIVDDVVITLADQLEDSWIAGFDLASGKPLWKTARIDGVIGGYSTPGTYRNAQGNERIISSGPTGLFAYEPQSGKLAWSVAGVCNAPVTVPLISEGRALVCEPVGEPTPIGQLAALDKNKDGRYELAEVKNNVAIHRLMARMDKQWGNDDGVIVESEWNKAFGTMLNKGGLVAVDLIDEKKEDRVQWNYRKAVPYVASPVSYEGLVYFVQDGGILTALDADTGELVKRGRLQKGGRKFYASLVAGDKKIYVVDISGTVTTVRAGRDWKVIAAHALGESCFASPAISNGRLLIRSARNLYCFSVVGQ